MDYSSLIEYGRKITKEKILNLQHSLELLMKHDYGVIIQKRDDVVTKFVAIEVDKKYHDLENIITVAANYFLCKKTNEFDLNKICDMFSDVNCPNKTIIISPGYSYDFSSPFFEAKCTLEGD